MAFTKKNLVICLIIFVTDFNLILQTTASDKGGATGWTGVDMSTPLSSGRYSFLSKNDIKIVRYTF